jgi:hypothetical protein
MADLILDDFGGQFQLAQSLVGELPTLGKTLQKIAAFASKEKYSIGVQTQAPSVSQTQTQAPSTSFKCVQVFPQQTHSQA